MSTSKDNKVIAHISEDGRGGGQLQYISDILTDQSIRQVILCPESINRYQSDWKKNNVKHIPIRLRSISMGLKNILLYLLFFVSDVIKLICKFKQEQVNLVVCHSATQFKGIIAAHVSGLPKVWVMHDTYQPKSVRIVFNLMCRMCNHYIYVSKRAAQYYTSTFQPLSNNTSPIIPSGIDHQKFSPGAPSDLLSKTCVNILTVCYINKWKGLELLIETAAEVYQRGYHNIRFNIVGPVINLSLIHI